MEGLALLGYGSFVVASLAVGVRLLLLWRRTHQTPELAIAVALIAGALAYAFGIAAISMPGLPPALAALVSTTAAFFAHLGSAALALAMRHIFRPEEGWARALQLGFTVALALAFSLRLVDPLAYPPPDFVFWPFATLVAAIYGWSVVESLHCHRLVARRERIGLAEPGLAQRFLLWAVAAGAAFCIYAVLMVERLLRVGTLSSWTIAVTSVLGLVSAAGIWLAFFPRRRAVADAPAVAPGDAA